MASPSYDKSCQFGLQLNPYYTEPIFNTCSHIQMKFPSGDDITFESLCSALINYTKDLLLEIDKTKGISNIQFPFDCAAKASHALLLEQIEKESESYFNGVTPITAAEFPHLFDCTGTLNEPHIFKNRLFLCGCDHEILTSVIPFAIGAYKLNSTSEDRKQLEHYWKEESARLSAQVSTAKKMPNNKSLRSNFSVILNDVERTDRREKAFANIDKPGPSMVTQVLNQYLVYNPSFGYIQGLNDHVVPFILAYFPKWNDEGYPIDDDGNIIDHSSFMPKLLWYFVSEIDNLCFDKYLMSIFKRALDMDRKVINYMESFSPLFVLWVKRKGMNNLNFFYPGIVLMLKRSCENVFDIWDIWIHIHTSPDPKNWFLCIVIAMVIHLFPLFQFDDNDLSCQTKISDVWENPLRYVRIKELKKTAIWVYRKKALPREYEERERKIDFENEFKIFEINNIE
ncbi:TBC domain containing protein [Histomonas meleagridis]|uniref:TBC domain containing protein n=1 Tax=Histomonas meleagridis TaxID=135588 RepID=UPI00355A1B8D|nr:TBC domain containing protein [Histomonas meleagridis]KAH0804582.1 TBC domain containing protein [Histomonas meleagridis]